MVQCGMGLPIPYPACHPTAAHRPIEPGYRDGGRLALADTGPSRHSCRHRGTVPGQGRGCPVGEWLFDLPVVRMTVVVITADHQNDRHSALAGDLLPGASCARVEIRPSLPTLHFDTGFNCCL